MFTFGSANIIRTSHVKLKKDLKYWSSRNFKKCQFSLPENMYPEVSFAKVTISKRAMDQSYQSVQVGCPKSRASSQNQKPNGLGLFTLWSTSIIGKVEELWTPLALPGTILICWIFMIIFSMDWLKLRETIDFPIKKRFPAKFPSNQSIDFSLLHSQTHNYKL